jgi:hypothetical protein
LSAGARFSIVCPALSLTGWSISGICSSRALLAIADARHR